MGVASRFLNQWRKPTGKLGRVLAWALNISHSRGTRWGLQHITVGKDFSILDIGCGGGALVHELAEIATEGKVYGIDYSAECVVVSQRTNRPWIRMGRAGILRGAVSALPFSTRGPAIRTYRCLKSMIGVGFAV
jgi:SAM-dependent methyltransferase